MYLTIALVCLASIPRAACNERTARVVQTIGSGDNELSCLRWGALSLAENAVRPKAGAEYVRVVCRRKGKV